MEIYDFFKIIIVVNFVYVSVTFISLIQRGVFTNGVLIVNQTNTQIKNIYLYLDLVIFYIFTSV